MAPPAPPTQATATVRSGNGRRPLRVLVVSPAFHGYWQALAQAFEHLGCTVASHCYDTGTTRSSALRNALAHRVPASAVARWSGRASTDAAVAALAAADPDAVLVVKGDLLDDRWWDALTTRRIPYTVWLYDELANMDYDLGRLAALDRVLSYSAADVAALEGAGVRTGLLPNGFDSLTSYTPRPMAAISFVGARYPERETLLHNLAGRGLPVVAWGREWSRHPWDIARTRRWRSAHIPARRDIPRDHYYGVMAGSTATLNIHGTAHQGLSMRTFEAPGVGALALIDRPEVSRYYEVGAETLLFTGEDELVEQLARAESDPHWASAIREAGARRTAAEHTFVHRMAAIMDGWRDDPAA